MKPKTIHVTFVEGSTNQTIGHTDLTIDQLPANFEISTTLHIGDQDWHVDKAEPPHADEFGRTGALRLTLSKISYINPKDILYTLPTIENAAPRPNRKHTTTGHHTIEVHEDDWRQIEFVSVQFILEIEAEVADIEAIYREQSVNNGQFLGFRQIHLRKRIPEPILPPLSLQDIEMILGEAEASFEGVSFERMPGVVPDSFAFQVHGLTLYGQRSADGAQIVRSLCMREPEPAVEEPAQSSIQRLMAAHSLCLVDWSHMIVIRPGDAESLTRYLTGQQTSSHRLFRRRPTGR